MTFECASKSRRKVERWKSVIPKLKRYGSHHGMMIESLSEKTVLFDKTSYGTFAYKPYSRLVCYLGNLEDKFCVTEKLVEVLGEVDGISVADALWTISDKIDGTKPTG